MQKGELLYSGKAKSLFYTDDPSRLIMQYRDDITAFNAEKKDSLARKGLVNNQFNAFIMEHLAEQGVPCHFEKCLTATESLVKNLQMIPVECVIRNRAAGSLCKRLGVEEGKEFKQPIFEFFYKNDELGDPFINDYHIRELSLASDTQMEAMSVLTHKVNALLIPLFLSAGLHLIDFKLEFGLFENELYLGDEFTPDGCRLWDSKTNEKLDKDRFRQGLGNVIESYEGIADRLGIKFTE